MTGGPGGPVRIAVIGCGAIGSLYAAHLARVPGVEVWAVDPWAEHVAAMNSRGLRVTGREDFTVPVHARTDGGELPACHFGLVATKAQDTHRAVAGARAALVVPPVLGAPGGLPVRDGGQVVAGLGVGGGDPAVCADIARIALDAS